MPGRWGGGLGWGPLAAAAGPGWVGCRQGRGSGTWERGPPLLTHRPHCLPVPSIIPDYQLARACEDEAARLCGAARGTAGDASVFTCLVGRMGGGDGDGGDGGGDGLSGACAAEVARTARTGLDFYEQAGFVCFAFFLEGAPAARLQLRGARLHGCACGSPAPVGPPRRCLPTG